jgi:hypothetical protein
LECVLKQTICGFHFTLTKLFYIIVLDSKRVILYLTSLLLLFSLQSYQPMQLLMYYDEPSQWPAVYKTGLVSPHTIQFCDKKLQEIILCLQNCGYIKSYHNIVYTSANSCLRC